MLSQDGSAHTVVKTRLVTSAGVSYDPSSLLGRCTPILIHHPMNRRLGSHRGNPAFAEVLRQVRHQNNMVHSGSLVGVLPKGDGRGSRRRTRDWTPRVFP